MNFSIGELVFNSNFKDEDISLRSGLNATEVTSYQYLGMTKIAGAFDKTLGNFYPLDKSLLLRLCWGW
jgi:hypothetical protein